MVKVKNLTVKINNQILLDKVSCSLLPGRITCFIGKSGAGKTTFLKSLVNLISITEGKITINNNQLDKLSYRQKSEEIGYVFQNFNLFSNLTVLENCTDPLIVHELDFENAKNQALIQLKKLGMENYINKYPSELSGGQQQRIAIARALCLNPKVLLLDEPTASLDPVNTEILINILKALTQSGLTIGISSQDMNFINKIFDRVYYIKKGKIIEFCDGIENLKDYPLIKSFINSKVSF